MKAFIIFNVLIVVIIILRSLFEGKISRKAQYAMWLFLPLYIVLSSLISIPISSVSIPSSRIEKHNLITYSVNETQIRNNEDIASMYNERVVDLQENNSGELVDGTLIETSAVNNNSSTITDNKSNTNNVARINYPGIIYVIGALFIASVIIINNVVFTLKIRKNREFYSKSIYGSLNVYRLYDITVPFLSGKSIYIPNNFIDSIDRYKYALCHEYSHYKQGDSFWSVIKYVFLTLFWFDPLVWVAFVLVERDSEMSADENAIKIIGTSGRSAYSEMLLDFATNSYSGKAFVAITSMNGKSHSFIKTRVRNVIYGTRKSIALLLVSVLLLASFVGCSLINNDKKASQISSEDKWYSYSAFDMKSDYQSSSNPMNYYFCQSWALGEYNNEFIQIVTVTSDDETEQVTLLEYFDEAGDKTNVVDIGANLGGFEANFMVLDATRRENKINLITFENTYEYDLSSGAFADNHGTTGDQGAGAESGLTLLETTEHSLEFDGAEVDFIYVNDSINYYKISITYPNGYSEIIDLRTAIAGTPVQRIEALLPYDDSNVIFISVSKTVHYYKLNVTNGDIAELVGDDVAFLSDYYFQNLTYLSETNELIGTNSTGFYRIDFSNRTIEKVFDWNWCTFDRTLFFSPKIVEYSEDKIVVMENDSYGENSYCLTLTKENTNPNAGKYILTIDGTTLSSQVSKFNETDDMYYIEIDNRYSTDGMFSGYYSSLEDVATYHSEALRIEQSLSNQMAIDLMAGESPDIICDAYSSSQLLNSDLLYDLSDLINSDSDYDESLYFQNVIEASRVNDKLLYMPLTFGVNAIGTIASNYSDVDALTYDEYREFVTNVCNGKDPVAYRRYQFVENLMPSTILYCFDDEGKINFDNESFRELLTYANNDFHERNEELDMFEFKPADSLNFYSIGDYLTYVSYRGWNYNNVNLISYPNHNGTGLSIGVESSVSISANAVDVDGCFRFIKFLMSYEQSTINRHAFETIQEMSLDEYNLECDYYNAMREESGMNITSVPSITAGSEMIDYYQSIIERCEYVNYSDPAINLIIYEETQAYFAGDKTLDEVIVIMNDRAQRVIDERG